MAFWMKQPQAGGKPVDEIPFSHGANLSVAEEARHRFIADGRLDGPDVDVGFPIKIAATPQAAKKQSAGGRRFLKRRRMFLQQSGEIF